MNEDKYFNRRLPLINKLLHSYRAIELNEECNDLSKLTNINKCKSCGGECCCNYPCSFDPDDFLRIKSDRYMEIILNTGLVTISKEFFLGGHRLILRPRGYHDSDESIIGDDNPDMWNCKCVLNSDEGCLLSPKVRPLGGLLLIPTDKRCNQVYTDAKQFRRWSPYQNRLKYLSRLYSERKVLIPDTVDKEQVKKLEFALRGEKYS